MERGAGCVCLGHRVVTARSYEPAADPGLTYMHPPPHTHTPLTHAQIPSDFIQTYTLIYYKPRFTSTVSGWLLPRPTVPWSPSFALDIEAASPLLLCLLMHLRHLNTQELISELLAHRPGEEPFAWSSGFAAVRWL